MLETLKLSSLQYSVGWQNILILSSWFVCSCDTTTQCVNVICIHLHLLLSHTPPGASFLLAHKHAHFQRRYIQREYAHVYTYMTPLGFIQRDENEFKKKKENRWKKSSKSYQCTLWRVNTYWMDNVLILAAGVLSREGTNIKGCCTCDVRAGVLPLTDNCKHPLWHHGVWPDMQPLSPQVSVL